MKKYIYVTIAACAVLLFSLQSCKKEEYKSPISGKESVISYSVSNGRLVFENKAKLNAKIEELSKLNFQEFKSWEKVIGFNSYRTFQENIIQENWENYKKLKEDAPEKEYNKYVIGPYSLISNQNAEFQVGDSILFIIENKIVCLPYEGEANFIDLKKQVTENTLKSINESGLKTRKFLCCGGGHI